MLGTFLLLLTSITGAQSGVQVDTGIRLIPQPLELERSDGWFVITERVTIVAPPDSREVALELQRSLIETTGMQLQLTLPGSNGESGERIELLVDGELGDLGEEGYLLSVEPQRVLLRSKTPTGLFYGTQTLLQLLPLPRVVGQPCELVRWVVPCLRIEDSPRFPWRGVMLDCSRTFQSIDYLKKTIERLAFYKMNVLHLHLTDDQGWRLELDGFPELTAKGARFPSHFGEPESHQGYYTKDEIRDLLRFAAARGVTIVPEIEMPGHSLAALSCYPELSCTGGPFEIHPFFKGPGIHAEVFCAGTEETFTFLEGVLAEVTELFPSHYVHIGGDEVPKSCWEKCERCQARIREEGLADEHELQSWFIKRIEAFLTSKGRALIGWDEILEGGLAPRAAVMSWRGMGGGITAAGSGHDVVMSPTSHCYFDYRYERIDTERAYSFEPVPDELDEGLAKHILGLQANFWSHIDREPELVDRQLFPRLLAIAERGWSPRDTRDWEDFRWRVKVHLVHLDELGVEYFRDPPSLLAPPIGSWNPERMSEDYAPLTWDVSAHIRSPARYRFRFVYSSGAHRLRVERVELLHDGMVVSVDEHSGVAGSVHDDNEYVLDLASLPPGGEWTLRASARSEGGLDSNGGVHLVREQRQ